MNDYREHEINTTPPEADGNQEVADFTLFPFTIKDTRIPVHAQWFLGGTISPSSWLALSRGEQ